MACRMTGRLSQMKTWRNHGFIAAGASTSFRFPIPNCDDKNPTPPLKSSIWGHRHHAGTPYRHPLWDITPNFSELHLQLVPTKHEGWSFQKIYGSLAYTPSSHAASLASGHQTQCHTSSRVTTCNRMSQDQDPACYLTG